MRKVLLIILCCCCAVASAHQKRVRFRPSSSLVLGLGHANLLDSYLSPLEYKGMQFNMMHEYRRTLDWNNNLGTFRSTLQANGSAASAWGGLPDMWSGDLNYDAVWQYSILGSDETPLCIKLGGGAGTTFGGTYVTHGGNNPAQAHVQLRLLGSFTAHYNFTKLCLQNRRLKHLKLRYHADLPLLGGMFSPEFGQSYYELSQGLSGHNIVLTHPVNAFSLRQQLGVDFGFSDKSPYKFRVTYLNDIRQATPHHLKQHLFSNSLMIGFVKYLRH